MIPKTIAFALLVATCAIAWSQPSEKDKQSSDRDKKLLQRYPDADKNKDGVLSDDELQDLKKSMRKNKGAATNPSVTAGAPATRPSKEDKKAKREANMRVQPTFTDVAYGPFERNRLDFWKAKSDGPSPVMVLIHGGGFTGGDKSFWYSHPLLSSCYEHGISVASINYRLIRTDPYPAPMHDGARAVQFLRSKAAEWNIDPNRIGASGGSAGACIAIWLATHDDLADPASQDPVTRQSSRLALAMVYDVQTALDPEIVSKINPRARSHPWYHMLFGVSSAEDFDKLEMRKTVYDATATNHVTKDDPPIYMSFQMDLTPVPLPAGEQNMHHPYFGVMLKEKMDAAGLECVLHYKSKPARPDEDIEFSVKHFAVK